MIERDWTTADQADAADAEHDRNWWRRDSSLCPWPDEDDLPTDSLRCERPGGCICPSGADRSGCIHAYPASLPAKSGGEG